MVKFLIFGTGKIASHIMSGYMESNVELEIVGFLDNDMHKAGQLFFGKRIYHPGELCNLQYDYICILTGDAIAKTAKKQLIYGYGIAPEKIVDYLFLLKTIMSEKFKASQDPDIINTLDFWQENPISFFNQFQYKPETYDEVFWDASYNMPYVWYKGKKIYYPRGYKDFIIRNDKMYVVSYREMEQAKDSPHRYLTQEIQIKNGDVVIDAGAREGDFALEYIDIIRKLYLFECDPAWIEALELTYKDYKDKVCIIPKMLTDYCDDEHVTLEEAVKEQVDFIKMDIEGAEVPAVLSAESMFMHNDIRCAICCYHKRDDKESLVKALESWGYTCTLSKGYVVFIADPDIFRDADFRKGIVYGYKNSRI